MALQVWLPLNGNLENKGLKNISIVNSGATVNESGKIGSCYSFTNSKIICDNPNIPGSTISASAWIYLTNISSLQYIISLNNSGGWADQSIGISVEEDDIYFCAGSSYCSSSNIQTNKWFHAAVTYDGSKIRGYIDGIEVASINASSPINRNFLTIGARYNGSSYAYLLDNAKLNDIRIYDHALSQREVKELSQALMLHYKLDENYQVMNNVFTNPTFDSSSATAGWSHWAPSGSTYTYSQNTNKEYIFNKANTYSHKITVTAGERMILYQSPAFSGGYRSAQAIVKLEDGSNPMPTYESSTVWISANAMTDGGRNSCVPLGDGFYLIKREGFYQDGSNDLVALGVSLSAGTVYVSEFYLEDNRTVCSNILWLNDIITDVSGYGHHGQIITGLTTQTDSPRYETCTLNSEGYPLRSVFDFPQSNGLTIACWIYLTAWGSQGSGLWSTSTISTSNPSDYLATTCNHCDGKFYLRGTNGTSYNITCGTGVISLNTWNHVVLTHDGENIKVYVNSILKYTQPCPTSLIGFKSLFLGYSNAGSLSRQCKGKWSDFRMYATALSAEDIADLYHTSAMVDNFGNFHTFQLEEQSENLFRIEELQKYARTGQSYILHWIDRNGEKAVGMGPSQFYENGSYKSILLDRFKENTQYKFDIWMDADDVVYNGNNVTGGLRVLYTDGTEAPYTSLTTVGNASSPMGFQHKVFYSDPTKTVKRLFTYYYIATNVYYRWDSVIMPVENTTDIKKTGISKTGQFREQTLISAEITKGDIFNTNEFIEI